MDKIKKSSSFRIRLPDSKTPTILDFNENDTALDIINKLHQRKILNSVEYSLILPPSERFISGKILDKSSIISELDLSEKDVLEFWKQPEMIYIACRQIAKEQSLIRKSIPIDFSLPLANLVWLFKKIFKKFIKDQEFCFESAQIVDEDSNDLLDRGIEVFNIVGEDSTPHKLKWLNSFQSLNQQNFQKQEEFLVLYPLSLLQRKSPRDRAEKSGWFSKSIRKNKKNIKVWISLHNYFLYLWTKPKDTTPLGIIPLEFYSVRKIIEKGEIVLVLERLFLEFDIEDEEQRLITLSTETPEEIDEWFEVLLTKCIPERKVFGAPLFRQGTNFVIPNVLQKCVEYIKEKCFELEGIFRESPNQLYVEEFKQKFDTGEQVDFSTCEDPHTAAGVLKLFLRSLPEPLLTYQYYDRFLETYTANQTSNSEMIMKQMLSILNSLPEENVIVLKWIAEFLMYLTQFNGKNKMDTENFSIVFGPIFLACKDDSIDKMLRDAPIINQVAACILANYHLINLEDYSVEMKKKTEYTLHRRNTLGSPNISPSSPTPSQKLFEKRKTDTSVSRFEITGLLGVRKRNSSNLTEINNCNPTKTTSPSQTRPSLPVISSPQPSPYLNMDAAVIKIKILEQKIAEQDQLIAKLKQQVQTLTLENQLLQQNQSHQQTE